REGRLEVIARRRRADAQPSGLLAGEVQLDGHFDVAGVDVGTHACRFVHDLTSERHRSPYDLAQWQKRLVHQLASGRCFASGPFAGCGGVNAIFIENSTSKPSNTYSGSGFASAVAASA